MGGVVSDLMGCRAPITVGMLVAAMGALWGYSKSPHNEVANGFLMALTGFFIGGPANLISSAISADLGRSPEVAGNAEAISTVTGILDGTGSVGAAFGQVRRGFFFIGDLAPNINGGWEDWGWSGAEMRK